MTAQMEKINRHKTLRVRLSEEEWKYLAAQKQKGTSYNATIRAALFVKMKTKIPF